MKAAENWTPISPPGASRPAIPATGGVALGFARLAVSGLFMLAMLYTLYFAKPVLLPIALALLFALVLRPLVRALQTLRLPESLAAAIVVGGLLALTATGIYFLAEPAMRWVENAPKTLREVERKVSGLKHSIATVQRATAKIDDITRASPGTPAPPRPRPRPRRSTSPWRRPCSRAPPPSP